MTYNLPACPDRFADLADAMHATKPGMSRVEKGDAAIEAVIRLARDCGIPENWSSALGGCGIPRYARICDRVEVVRNVAELGAVAEALVAGAPAQVS